MAGNLPLPIVYTNWGFTTDWSATVDSLVANLKLLGAKTVAIRLGTTSVPQRKLLKTKMPGITVAGWENLRDFGYTGLTTDGCDAIMPQIETPEQFNEAHLALSSGWAHDKLLSIITNYSNLENGQYGQLQVLGVKGCYTECYADDGAVHADLDRMLNQGIDYKIPKSDLVAVVGTYRSETPASYTGLSTRGKQIGIYLAEPMTPDQWKAWATLPDIPAPPPPPVIVNPSDQNMLVVTDTDRWLRQQSGPQTNSRMRVENRIALNGVNPTPSMDAAWKRAAPQIVAILNQEGISL